MPSSLLVVLAVLFAVGVPAIFLLVIYTLDMYASRTFQLVLLCFAWGAVGGVGLAYLFNTYAAVPLIQQLGWSLVLLYVAFAPVAEEILKSLVLLYTSRRPEFTYFVDGAIYGFASGIGFSIAENILYIGFYPDQGLALTLVRSFSVCLMHGTSSALVGAAIGRFRFQKRSGRSLAMVGGWSAAVLLHVFFNAVSKSGFFPQGIQVPLQVVLGLAGVGLIAFFITLGLREQRLWFAETLDRKMGISGAEVRAAQAYTSIDEVLEPLAKQFPRQAEKVSGLLLRQAQMGIKRKVQQQLEDEKIRAQLETEIIRLKAEMEQLRKEIGPYIMTFVRTVFPEGLLDMWGRLESLAIHFGPPDIQKWAEMLQEKRADGTTPPVGIFDLARTRSDEVWKQGREPH